LAYLVELSASALSLNVFLWVIVQQEC